jgi:hypothetical protein
MTSFKELQKKYGINEVQYFYEFMGLKNVDLELAKSQEFFANIIALELVKYYKTCNKSLIELLAYSSPPVSNIERNTWICLLEKIWKFYD